MPDYSFEREMRTPSSESYSIEQDGDAIGRVDLHFGANNAVRVTLCVPPDFDDDDIEELIADVDERLVLTANAYRDDFIVTVWRGEQAGVFSPEDDEDEDDAEEQGSGLRPVT